MPDAENGPGTVEKIARPLLTGITGRKTVAGRFPRLSGRHRAVGIEIDY